MTDALRQVLRTKLSELIKFPLGILLLSTAAAGAHAQNGNDMLKNTSYKVSVGDVNGDGREDILMKAVPRMLMIPLEDDLTIPIAIPAKTPSFALMSDAYWGYVLVPNPDAQLLQSNWSAANSGTLQFGVNGQHADTVRIQSASGEFIVAFSDVSQQLSLVQQPGVIKVPGTVTYIHTDGLGSPVARTNAAGQLLSRTLYEPYGYVAMGETPTIGFTGHVNDADTGLTYMQQRYYDPLAGRFLSIDPVVTNANSGSSFNRYVYGNNNPYLFVDPDGKFAVWVHWAITYSAARDAGYGFRDSVRHANRAWMADWESGSQGKDAGAAARHAMRAAGSTPLDAIEMNRVLVATAVGSKDLGLAAHAIQDRYAKGHADFKLWEGFRKLGFIGTLTHLWADMFPSHNDASRAYDATRKMFEGATESGAQGPAGSGNSLSSPAGKCGAQLLAGCNSPNDPLPEKYRQQNEHF